MDDTESFAIWDEIFHWLKNCGLKEVMVVISDDHGRLMEAVAKHFQGTKEPRNQLAAMSGASDAKHLRSMRQPVPG